MAVGRLMSWAAATLLAPLAVVTAPVQASTPPGWEPQIVRASGVDTPAEATAAGPHAGPQLVSAVTRAPRGLPAGVGSERGLQIQTIRIKRAISARFPEILDIGGWRQDSMKWHPNGLAIDVIIPKWDTPAGKALGDRIAQYAMANAKRFKLEAVIWQRTYHPTGGTPHLMDDLGNPDANHYTHVHIATYGGGYPTGDETYFD